MTPSQAHEVHDWYISVPAWETRYVDIFLQSTLPALLIALRRITNPRVTIVVHTDQNRRIQSAYDKLEKPEYVFLENRPVPGPDRGFHSLSNAHREVLGLGIGLTRIGLLTADMVVSKEILGTCETYLRGGNKAVCCAAPRTCDSTPPPIGASGGDLLAWSWARKHPMTRESLWPNGTSYDVWRMYFEKGDEVAARIALPHPLVVLPQGRRLVFNPTIDVNLLSNFPIEQTKLLTRPEEGAVIELSPEDKEFLITRPMHTRYAVGGEMPSCPPFRVLGNPRHREFYRQKIVLKGGGGDCGDEKLVNRFILGT